MRAASKLAPRSFDLDRWMSPVSSSPTAQARYSAPSGPTDADGARAGCVGSPATRTGREKLPPPSSERVNHRVPAYSVHTAYSTPFAPAARSRLPLCQICLLMRPLPSPPTDLDRFIGAAKDRPPSSDRANRISPPCEPPEKMI